MPIKSRRKGKAGELQFAHWLSDAGFPATRGAQHSGSPDSPDVRCDALPVHWEVKFTQALRLYDALAQAQADCGSKIPVVAHRRNRGEWIAILPMHSLLNLLTARAQQKLES